MERPNKKSNVTTAEASPTDPALQAELLSEIKQAQAVADKTKAKGEQAAADMFQLYTNLLSVNAKYVWNEIVHEQTASDLYIDLQSCSKKGPRGLLCKSFNECMLFHILTMFSNNAAEQEWYYITNVLKKPQRVSICQFVQHVEQLNSYTAQLPCWYYSLKRANLSSITIKVLFAEADLASHVLWMCPHTW
jgi:hypothetical protein